MKFLFFISVLLVSYIVGCHSTISPVGEWQLCFLKNGKLEKMTHPETVMTIYHDGKFSCSALEDGKYEHNAGTWEQEGTNIILHDKTGTYRAMITSNHEIVFCDQPFQNYGIKLVYVRRKQ